MSEQVTIVTALYDIGRGGWSKVYNRKIEEYIGYFEFWARIQNNLVVYTTSHYRDAVMGIRAKYGLLKQTHVVVIDDLNSMDSCAIERLKDVLAQPLAVQFRVFPDHPECYIPHYDYLMYLKPQFVKRAVESGLADGMIAWLDFGYNHGGEYFINPEDFAFTWTTDLPGKINLFTFYDDLYDLPIFEVVRTLKTYAMGSPVVAPAPYWIKLVGYYREALNSLADCGLADDDQTLALMSYRKHPDDFNLVRVDDWGKGFLVASNHKMEEKQPLPHKVAKMQAKEDWHRQRYLEAMTKYKNYLALKIKGQ